MKKRWEYMQSLSLASELPGEPLPKQPLIELSGDSRVLIERHEGVTQYGRNEICVKVSFGCVHICGCDLELVRMAKEQLVITGTVSSVSLHRGK